MQQAPAYPEFASERGSETYLYSKGHARFALTVFFVLMLFDFMDRQVIAALLPTIKTEWHLTDTQLGLAVGIVNIAIAIFAFPFSYIADQWSRTKSSAWMAMVWSLATLACAFAGSFAMLLVARFWVGVGEAAYSAPGSAVLAAHYPRSKRNTAVAIFQAAGPIGSVLGVVVGGVIATHWGWRHAFGLVALPGMLFAWLLFWVKDYPQAFQTGSGFDATATPESPSHSWRAALRHILGQPLMVCVLVASALQFLVVATLANWLPSYFHRAYGLSLSEAGLRTGVFILLSALGLMLGGWLADRRGSEKIRDRLGILMAFVTTTGLSFCLAMALSPGLMQTLLLYFGGFWIVAFVGPVVNLLQDQVPRTMAVSALGIWVTLNNVLGMALGPVLTGILSDQSDLGHALQQVCMLTLAGAGLLWLARRMVASAK